MHRFDRSVCVAFTLAAVACGSHDQQPGGVEPSNEVPEMDVEAALATLPEDLDERGKMLDELRSDFPDNPDVLAAEWELERDRAQGFYRAIELGDGRRVTFIELTSGGLILTESGPDGTHSAIAELGLSEASPTEIWNAVLPGESVPEIIAAATEATTLAESADAGAVTLVDGTPAEVHEMTWGGGQALPYSTERRETSDGTIGVTRQATTPSQFFQAGGCNTQPAPGATDYAGILNPLVCLTDWWNGFFAEGTTIQFRFRFKHEQGDGFHIVFRRGGTLESTHFVAAGSWFNIRRGWVVHCTTKCCGFLGNCFVTCTKCNPIASTQRIELINATGDRFHVGGFFMNSADDRSDTQPWL